MEDTVKTQESCCSYNHGLWSPISTSQMSRAGLQSLPEDQFHKACAQVLCSPHWILTWLTEEIIFQLNLGKSHKRELGNISSSFINVLNIWKSPPGNRGQVEREGVKDLCSTGWREQRCVRWPTGSAQEGRQKVRDDQGWEVLGVVNETWNRIPVLCQRSSRCSRF